MAKVDAVISKENNLVLSAKDAAYLITKRESLGKLILSIKGTITALSNVIRVGRDLMFLVEVDTCLILVIKDFHLEWHSELEPGALFVFYNLRLTTLEKGISKPCSVFLILATSSFSRLIDVDTVRPSSLKEWLKQNNIVIPPKDKTLEPGGIDCDNGHGLINYEGTVTSTENAASGIFILDDRIRLVSLSGTGSLLKQQSRVSVYNGHVFKEDGLLYLVCCTKSCVKVHEPVLSCDVKSIGTGECEGSTSNKVRTFILNLLRQYELNFMELKALLHLHSKLCRQGMSNSCQDGLFVCFVKSCVCTDWLKSSTKVTDIFIEHSRLCSLCNSQTSGCRIPRIVDLCSLKEEVSQVQSASAAGQNSLTEPVIKVQSASAAGQNSLTETVIKVQSSAHHFILSSSNQKVLVGQIIMCPQGIVFKDATSELRLITLSESGDMPDRPSDDCGGNEHPYKQRGSFNGHPHLCCDCCFNQSPPGAQLVCPILDPWLVGRNICVRKYHVVVESYHSTGALDDVGSGDFLNNEGVLVYLAFSLLDCVLLNTFEICPPASVHSLPESSSLSSDSSFLASSSHVNQSRVRKRESEFSCHMYVHEKQPLIYTGNPFKERLTCQFQVVGRIIEPGVESVKVSRCGQSCLARRNKSEICHLKMAATNQENASLTDGGNHNSRQQTSTSICVSFPGTTSKWYSCIRPGHLYRFTSRSTRNLDPFAPIFSNVKLQKVAEDCKVTTTMAMPDDVLVERLPLDLPVPQWQGLDRAHLMQPVSLILSESFSETIVSFCGIIASRDYSEPFTSDKNMPGVKSPSMANVRLEVKEISSLASEVSNWGLTVYFDNTRTVYTLGLVPGAVVKLHQVARKVSQAGNIYCKFIPISVAEVVTFTVHDSTRGKFLLSKTQHIVLENVPKEHLINIWQGTLEHFKQGEKTFRIHCHIDKIFKLSIKNQCSSCNGVYLKKGCGRCGSQAFPITASNAVLLVEDGTCPATVKIWSSEVVRQLLTLTTTQWQELAAEALVLGEVLIDSTTPQLSTIACFLSTLVGSPLVLRSCKMVVKKARGNMFSDLDKMSLEDFQENEVKVGKHFLKTLSLPRMQLECLMISDVD